MSSLNRDCLIQLIESNKFPRNLPEEQYDEYIKLLKWKTIADQASIFDPFKGGARNAFDNILNPLFIAKDYDNEELKGYLKKYVKTDNTYLLEWAFNWVYSEGKSFIFKEMKYIVWSLFTKNNDIIKRCILHSYPSFNDLISIYLYTYYVTNDTKLCEFILDSYTETCHGIGSEAIMRSSIREKIDVIDLEKMISDPDYEFPHPYLNCSSYPPISIYNIIAIMTG